jgi:hypothetical protein
MPLKSDRHIIQMNNQYDLKFKITIEGLDIAGNSVEVSFMLNIVKHCPQ